MRGRFVHRDLSELLASDGSIAILGSMSENAPASRAGLIAVIGALIGIAVSPFHALAYFATPDGEVGVIKWAEFGRDLLEPVLDWSDADTVYRTYGKVFVIVGIAYVAGLYGLRMARRGARGVEMWGMRVAPIGYLLLLVGALAEYWGPEDWLDPAFMFLSGPGLLVSLVGSTLLGIGMVRRKIEPRLGAWLLVLSFPLLILFVASWGHIPMGLIPLDVGWIAIGWALWKGRVSSVAAPS